MDGPSEERDNNFAIRSAAQSDVPQVIEVDSQNTGLEKPEYWADCYTRFGNRKDRFFLVAEDGDEILGFIIGEVRAWEFGSPPCGWIFALGVRPSARLRGVGSELFIAISDRLKQAGMNKVRTMLAVDDDLNMAFFRSQGMMGGPFIQLERPLD